MTPRRAPSQKTEPIQDPRCSGTGKIGDDVLLNRGNAFPALCSSCAEEHVDILKNYENLPQQTRRGRRCSSQLRVRLRESQCLPAGKGPAEDKITKDLKVNIARQLQV